VPSYEYKQHLCTDAVIVYAMVYFTSVDTTEAAKGVDTSSVPSGCLNGNNWCPNADRTRSTLCRMCTCICCCAVSAVADAGTSP
jgi:hypothetical protein